MLRRTLVLAAVLAVSAVLAVPAAADVFRIDPTQPPTVTLPPEEVAKLAVLQDTRWTRLCSGLSPDDRVICLFDPAQGLVFRDIHTGASKGIAWEFFSFFWDTEPRWRDAQTLIGAAMSQEDGSIGIASVNRTTGAFNLQKLDFVGFPLELSHSAGKLLALRVVAAADADRLRLSDGPPTALVKPVPLGGPFGKRVGPAVFEAEDRTVQVALLEIELVVLDLASGELQPVTRFSPSDGILDVDWSRDETRLVLVRGTFPGNPRGGVIADDDPGVLDGLGRLPTRENPFFTSNVVELYTLARKGLHRREIRPQPGEILAGGFWSPDSRTLLVQSWQVSRPEGHEHPSYGNFNASRYAFYSASGRLLARYARPEIGSMASLPQFLSSREVVFSSPWRLSYGFHLLDLRSGRLRRLPTPDGSIHQARAANRSGEIVYIFSSYQDPFEYYRIGLADRAPTQLTHFHDAVRAASQIRVDRVRFRLADGALREGHLIQPRDAAMPPRNVPMVVWQEGGPTAVMTPYWGSHVEAPFALLPNFGFAVLVVPLPGRLNFGPAFMDELADATNFGQVDIAEGVEIAEQLVARGYTSHDRLGITGCSYGGYFTSQSITSFPDVYAAANTQCTLLDLVDEWTNGYKSYVAYLEGRSLAEDPDEFVRDSPLRQAAQVKTPTLVFAGVNDFLPWQFSQEFHDTINAAGTKADFYLFDQEGHGLGWPSSQLVAAQAQIEWFRRYLKRD